jgi:DNA-binding NtrC family response regulator
MRAARSDIVLISADWKSRALIRAQLLEEGYDVMATDEWPVALRALRSTAKPKILIVDLQNLAEPATVLRQLQRYIDPDRVIVLGGLGTLPAADVKTQGFRVIVRPFAIGDVVEEAARTLGALATVPSSQLR